MGRVKIVLVKKVAKKLVADNPGKFTQDFIANKKLINELLNVSSKKLRNLVAGYVTRIVILRSAEASEATPTEESEGAEDETSETPSVETARSSNPP